jgi:ATP-dependent Lon protease
MPAARLDWERLRDALERGVFGLEAAKRRLLERAALGAAAPDARLPALLLVGPPGSGKDALLDALAAGLGAPVPRAALEDGGTAEDALGLAARAPLAVATAHHPDDVPPALARRFEAIRLHGYSRAEKLEIARRRLLPRALAALGAPGRAVEVSGEALARLVEDYAPEAGVDGLERRLAELVRRAAARAALGEAESVRVLGEDVRRLLGPPPAASAGAEPHGAEVGVAAGLAWTRAGGAPVLLEALRAAPAEARPAAGLAGAVETALAYIEARAQDLRVEPGALRSRELLVRATGADADAGALELACFLAVLSLATDRPVRRDVAAAGAVTLRGAVRPVGGVPEKVLAAERTGFRKVLVPQADFPALEAALAPATLASVEVVPVAHADDAAREALIDIVIARGIR